MDLLGDEVDTLLSLLGKIYIALDHYSPVLQHYPGVSIFSWLFPLLFTNFTAIVGRILCFVIT